VVGGYNILDLRDDWPAGTAQVAREGTMAASLGGARLGRPARRELMLDSWVPLPNGSPCTGLASPGAFSDHCGMLLRFSTTP
jgi:hypothetical protein